MGGVGVGRIVIIVSLPGKRMGKRGGSITSLSSSSAMGALGGRIRPRRRHFPLLSRWTPRFEGAPLIRPKQITLSSVITFAVSVRRFYL